MAYIDKKQIERLIEAESYFWKNSDWRDNEKTEKALWNIWITVEELLDKNTQNNKRAKEYMRLKRQENKNYGR